MDISLQSIKNILATNKLIKGRLLLTSTDIQILYRLKLSEKHKMNLIVLKDDISKQIQKELFN